MAEVDGFHVKRVIEILKEDNISLVDLNKLMYRYEKHTLNEIRRLSRSISLWNSTNALSWAFIAATAKSASVLAVLMAATTSPTTERSTMQVCLGPTLYSRPSAKPVNTITSYFGEELAGV